MAALVDGDAQRGEALYVQSLTAFEALGETKGIAEALTGLATAAVIRGSPICAGQLGGAAERARESFAGRALPVERRLAEIEFARARTEVGDVDWDAAWTSGRALRQDGAIAVALEIARV